MYSSRPVVKNLWHACCSGLFAILKALKDSPSLPYTLWTFGLMTFLDLVSGISWSSENRTCQSVEQSILNQCPIWLVPRPWLSGPAEIGFTDLWADPEYPQHCLLYSRDDSVHASWVAVGLPAGCTWQSPTVTGHCEGGQEQMVILLECPSDVSNSSAFGGHLDNLNRLNRQDNSWIVRNGGKWGKLQIPVLMWRECVHLVSSSQVWPGGKVDQSCQSWLAKKSLALD